MENFKKIDNEFYGSKYGLPRVGDPNELWRKIKENKELLSWSIKLTKDKFGERDIVNGLAICDSILVDYDGVDKDIYQELVNLIYSNEQIARIVQDGYSNGGFSYLLMTLWNPNLKLTDEQKKFAVNEAMNKIGTIKYKKEMEEYSKKLEEHGITDEITTTIDIDGCVNPIGAKTKNEYFNDVFCMLSDTQAHGSGVYDIRYNILRNPNWNLEEKQKLIMDFWYDDETYDEYLEQWEWGIVNDSANDSGEALPQFDKCEMYEYSYEDLLKFYDDKDTTDRIWEEILFCKQMHQLRPQQWEVEYIKPKVLQKTIQN
jgi:hypothetical protein